MLSFVEIYYLVLILLQVPTHLCAIYEYHLVEYDVMDGVASISLRGKLLSLLGHIQFVVHVASGIVERGSLSILFIKLSTR